ncbi:MAG: hydroxymethylglutaryl-CoA reductase, degradative [Kofleriaceae bacterium]|nr:hydroxymethylglutaryl-CoA reductase, degradative [Kofleriaceae bacterium]
MSSRLPGLYTLTVAERRQRVAEAAGIDLGELAALDGGLSEDDAAGMIENVLGRYALPFAVATNFTVDGADALVPMVVEEPSVVAAASNAARMVRAAGGFTTRVSPPVVTGQIQLTHVDDVDGATAALTEAAPALLARARELSPRLCARGGGPQAGRARVLARPPGPDGGVVVVHLDVDCRDAMGANLVNTLCERLAEPVAHAAAPAGGPRPRVGLRILSNLSDQRTVRVTCVAADDALADARCPGPAVRAAIAAASRFAELDPYRAATHNKGVMNGVDAVLVATGQDWRAVEAGAHAFAARTGAYRPLAVWREVPGGLAGELELPLAVGTVGGALHVHRGARLALRLAGADDAPRLAALAAAAGLACNLAALRALATDGIQHGHMALHARAVARAAGAPADLVDEVAEAMAAAGEIRIEAARVILRELSAKDLP